jgi:hypothetical protein
MDIDPSDNNSIEEVLVNYGEIFFYLSKKKVLQNDIYDSFILEKINKKIVTGVRNLVMIPVLTTTVAFYFTIGPAFAANKTNLKQYQTVTKISNLSNLKNFYVDLSQSEAPEPPEAPESESSEDPPLTEEEALAVEALTDELTKIEEIIRLDRLKEENIDKELKKKTALDESETKTDSTPEVKSSEKKTTWLSKFLSKLGWPWHKVEPTNSIPKKSSLDTILKLRAGPKKF